MTEVAHSTLTGAELHESKGVAAASANTVAVANGSGSAPFTSLATFLATGTAATLAEITRVADVSVRMVAAGATLSVTEALHDGKTILLNSTGGSVCTLPAASGSGMRLKFLVSVLATSASHIVKVASSSDIIQGVVVTIDTDTAGTSTGWATASDSDTITLNRTTTGSVMRGEWLELEDVASNLWLVRGQLANTASGATPFSATV